MNGKRATTKLEHNR